MLSNATVSPLRRFGYDALGNLHRQDDLSAPDKLGATTLTYHTTDRDRICSIAYGPATPPATCNVAYDGVGNIVAQPDRHNHLRTFTYFPGGQVATIVRGDTTATFDYDAFGGVQRLVLNSPSAADTRNDKHFGGLISRRDEVVAGVRKSVITRAVPGPGGLLATRHGPGANDPWTFSFGEARGARFVTDRTGAVTQDLSYQPYGEVTSSGAQPGSPTYQNQQWNGGDALAALGLSRLGARLYDPVIGRFLSRDPLILPRTASTTNPYAFADNDPVNHADPTGLYPGEDSTGQPPPCDPGVCGSSGPGNPGGFSNLGHWIKCRFIDCGPRKPEPHTSTTTSGSRASSLLVPVSAGPQTREGQNLKLFMRILGSEFGDAFDFDAVAKMGLSTSDLLDRIAETREAHDAVDEWNASINRISSTSAGYGDALNWWCFPPFCSGAGERAALGITSGDADPLAYTVGTIGGIATTFLLPKPTAIIGRPGVQGVRSARLARLGRPCACFVAGTLVATPKGEVPIEQLKLGDRVEAGNPRCADEHLADDTVTIGLEMSTPQQPSNVIRVELARPRPWLEERGLRDGTAWLELPEVGISGWARVTTVGPAPREASGAGCLVLMTVEHLASEVLKLRFETGAELDVTPTHPLFVEGSGWVPAGELRAGLLLRSDQGVVRLEAVEPAPPNQRVFNLEVGLEHTYRVSAEGIWAHNACLYAPNASLVELDRALARGLLDEAILEHDLSTLGTSPLPLGRAIWWSANRPGDIPMRVEWIRDWGTIIYDWVGGNAVIQRIVLF
jgi:RHS repeat-associated protein